MKFTAFAVVVIATLVFSRGNAVLPDATEAMLNSMEQLMTGSEEGFQDQEFLEQLFECMNELNPKLKEASDLAWSGLVQYADQDGVPGDEWGSCLNEGHCVEYFEQNATTQNFHNITIYEPCNYASNVAYYHTTVQICARKNASDWIMDNESIRSLGESFAHLAFGSAFWHGSHTLLGNIMDNKFIEILSWVAYQASVQSLTANTNRSVIMDLQTTPRPFTAIEISDQLTSMLLNDPVETWSDTILGLDMPNYYRTFAAIVSSVLTLAVDDETADQIIYFLQDLFSFPEEEAQFLHEELLPELRNATENIEVSFVDKLHLEGNFGSAVLKLVYAFVWQEWVVTNNTLIYDPDFNAAGADYIPIVNGFANGLNNFPIYDQDFQDGVDLYPGQNWCNDFDPHSKWHTQASIGLFDLIMLCDDIKRIIERRY